MNGGEGGEVLRHGGLAGQAQSVAPIEHVVGLVGAMQGQPGAVIAQREPAYGVDQLGSVRRAFTDLSGDAYNFDPYGDGVIPVGRAKISEFEEVESGVVKISYGARRGYDYIFLKGGFFRASADLVSRNTGPLRLSLAA